MAICGATKILLPLGSDNCNVRAFESLSKEPSGFLFLRGIYCNGENELNVDYSNSPLFPVNEEKQFVFKCEGLEDYGLEQGQKSDAIAFSMDGVLSLLDDFNCGDGVKQDRDQLRKSGLLLLQFHDEVKPEKLCCIIGFAAKERNKWGDKQAYAMIKLMKQNVKRLCSGLSSWAGRMKKVQLIPKVASTLSVYPVENFEIEKYDDIDEDIDLDA